MAHLLIDSLRSDPKTSYLFQNNCSFTGYKTGFPALDYGMGFNVNVYDPKTGDVVDMYPAIGITNGSIVTVIGKTHVGKTTWAIQAASAIVRPFANGMVMHYDLEGGTNLTRISNISRIPILEIESGKYILLEKEGSSIEEIKKAIAKIYKEKTTHPDTYKYETGRLDEFGNKIYEYEPTCMIVDSVPSLGTFINENTKDGLQELEEISSQTDKMRMTALISRFLAESMPMLKSANIILFLINHIKDKPSMVVPQPPELRYLKQNETMPAGKALQYYTNTMIRLTSVGSEKYTPDEHGFDGFGVQIQFCKNRSGVDGSIVPMVFDKQRGYDSIRSTIMLAKDLGLLGGNKNGYYFINNKDLKFRFDTAKEDFQNNRDLYNIMYSQVIPVLQAKLPVYKPSDSEVPPEEMDY